MRSLLARNLRLSATVRLTVAGAQSSLKPKKVSASALEGAARSASTASQAAAMRAATRMKRGRIEIRIRYGPLTTETVRVLL